MTMECYRLSEADERNLEQKFAEVLKDVDLERIDRRAIEAALPEPCSGCYFWLMRLADSRYKVYLGSSSSVRRRTIDYTNAFQIHSPNDYKLRLFQEYARHRWPDVGFDLHFMPVGGIDYRTRETELVRMFHPLINERLQPTEQERELVRGAFEHYYRSIFTRKLENVRGH